MSKSVKTEDFIKKATKKHNGFYTYDKSIYTKRISYKDLRSGKIKEILDSIFQNIPTTIK